MDYIRKFDNVTDYTRSAVNDPTDLAERYRRSKTAEQYDRWDYNAGFERAAYLADTGWTEGRDKVAKWADKFRDSITSEHDETFKRPMFTRSFVGSSVNVGRYVAGMPDAMVRRTNVEVEHSVVHILVNVCASAAISADTYTMRGAAVAALVDLLEFTNRRVRVATVFKVTGTRHHSAAVYTTIKKPNDPLQMDSLAYALAHPAYFRRLGFSILEQAPSNVRADIHIGDAGGYGQVAEVTNDADIYIGCLRSETDWTESKTRTWIADQLRTFCVLKEETA